MVGHLGSGPELRAALTAVCAEHDVRAGTLRGSGRLRGATLRQVGDEPGGWAPACELSGRLELLSLDGWIADDAGAPSLSLRAVLASSGRGAAAIVGGLLERATIDELTYAIDATDDLCLRTSAAGGPARIVAVEARSAGADAPEPVAAAATWADVVAASAAREEAPASEPAAPSAPEDDVQVAPGDLIDHPRFQRCTVYRVERDSEFVQVALKSGRVVRLSLDILQLTQVGVEGGQRVFQATVI